MEKRIHRLQNGLAISAVFFLVVAAGLAYGLFNLDTVATTPGPQPAAVMTEDQNREEARSILGPFISQASGMSARSVDSVGPIFSDLVAKTQDRLLRLRVPRDARDAHLSFVLLLDRWKRALDGSLSDKNKAIEQTATVLAAHPWLLP